ncbi:hypothetical protein [Nocardioides yefusunii]|uniref:Uncharacterized protein n=2 Tax=Nocardioides yefusunii TaxID=2500546 RepID=A0ABW1QXN6_9ACTN
MTKQKEEIAGDLVVGSRPGFGSFLRLRHRGLQYNEMYYRGLSLSAPHAMAVQEWKIGDVSQGCYSNPWGDPRVWHQHRDSLRFAPSSMELSAADAASFIPSGDIALPTMTMFNDNSAGPGAMDVTVHQSGAASRSTTIEVMLHNSCMHADRGGWDGDGIQALDVGELIFVAEVPVPL